MRSIVNLIQAGLQTNARNVAAVVSPAVKVTQNEEATFETKPYKLHKLDDSPSTKVTMTREEGLKFYAEMTSIRQMESMAARLYQNDKKIRGFLHLYNGQEACCVGMEASIDRQDAVIAGYRSHGWAFMRGISIEIYIRRNDGYELFVENQRRVLKGRVTGCSRGRGGSMHMFAIDKNYYGGHGIVCAQVPLGVGIAFAMKYENRPQICMSVYGDGAANQGQVFETFNMAKLWNLPVVFACENNGFGFCTGGDRASASTDYYTRGDYVPGIRVDGMDVLAVKEATKFARNYALKNGPIVLEAVTYRYYGHNMVDNGSSYRKQSDVDEIRQKQDPINLHRHRLVSSGLASDDELGELDEEINYYIEDVVNKVWSDPEPCVDELCKDVLRETFTPVRGCDIVDDNIPRDLSTDR